MVIRPFLAILVCLAGLTVNNGIGAPKNGQIFTKAWLRKYLASSIRFPDKNNVESKVFWASLGTGPMQKQKKNGRYRQKQAVGAT